MRNASREVAVRRSIATFYTLGIAGLIFTLLRSTQPFPLLSNVLLDSLILWHVESAVSVSSGLGLAAFGAEISGLSGVFTNLILGAISALGVLSLLRRRLRRTRRATLRRFLEGRYGDRSLVLKGEQAPLYLLIVLGSGGHTKEMLIMLEQEARPHPHSHRRYLVSSGDHMSLTHLAGFEANLRDLAIGGVATGTYDVHVIPRARRIHQSLLTTPFSAAWSIARIFPILLRGPATPSFGSRSLPDVVVTNGPATGFFVCLAAFVLRMLNIGEDKMQIVFIESWARIKSLSLTGRLLYETGIADLFLVQHEAVAKKYGVLNAGWLVLGGKQGRQRRAEDTG